MIHPNGGGLISDHAEARPSAYIDSTSQVRDKAWVQSGRVIDSTIGIECRITDNARIIRSVVSCDQVSAATIVESGVFDQARIFDPGVFLYRADVRGGARIYNNARIIGLNEQVRLWGDMRLAYGVWHRSPRYLHLGFAFLTESAPGWAAVDCKFAPYSRWFRIGERYARRQYGWQPEQLGQVREVFKLWQAEEHFQGKHWGECVPGCGVGVT